MTLLGNCYGLPNDENTKPWNVYTTEKPSQNIKIELIKINDLENMITTPWKASKYFTKLLFFGKIIFMHYKYYEFYLTYNKNLQIFLFQVHIQIQSHLMYLYGEFC